MKREDREFKEAEGKTRENPFDKEKIHKTNNERFNESLNSTRHMRRIYSMLMSIEPSIEQADQVREKRKVVIRELFAGLDVS